MYWHDSRCLTQGGDGSRCEVCDYPRPKCEVTHDSDETPDAVALAPQSDDAGTTISGWVRVCESDLETWWWGADWHGPTYPIG